MVGVAQLVEPRIVIPVVVGSSPIGHPIFCYALICERDAARSYKLLAGDGEPLAQLVEHLTFNQVLAGSNPARPTIKTMTYSTLKKLRKGR